METTDTEKRILQAALLVFERDGFLGARMQAIADEASLIDGAGAWQRLRHITLPLVAAPLASIFLLKLIIGFKLFDLVYVLTFGGPGLTTTNATFSIWRLALEQFDVGKAAAQTLIYVVVISIVTIPVLRLHRLASERAS